jgi:hypothetical protein
MLTFVPPAVAITALVAAIFLVDLRREEPAGTAPAGPLRVAMPAPFEPLAAWQSVVVTDTSGARWVLSYPPAGATRLGLAPLAALPAHWGRIPPGTTFGQWRPVLPANPAAPQFSVDGVVLPAPAISPPAAFAPVLATRL